MKLKKMPYAQASVTTYQSQDENGKRYTARQLTSYTTTVIIVKEYTDCTLFYCSGLYSATTRKHISAFMWEYYPDYSYQFIRDYCVGRTIKVDTLGNVTDNETGEFYGTI